MSAALKSCFMFIKIYICLKLRPNAKSFGNMYLPNHGLFNGHIDTASAIAHKKNVFFMTKKTSNAGVQSYLSRYGYEATTLVKGYQKDGFQMIDQPVVPPDLIARAIEAQDEVIQGYYETGRAPAKQYPDAPQNSIHKIDGAHVSNQAIFDLVTHPALGEFAAAISNAKEYVQLWLTTLLVKPGGDAGRVANVGWHQDNQYWHRHWTGELFTLWLALTDVDEESGPMVFVNGSHQNGLIPEGQFFVSDMDQLKEKFKTNYTKPWKETLNCLPAGGFSIHHKETIHGSHLNKGKAPRRSFALHLLNERYALKKDGPQYDQLEPLLNDPSSAPILWTA